MARKTSRKLVYVLSPNSSNNGHSLGVNALAVDPNAPDDTFPSNAQQADEDGGNDDDVASSSSPTGIFYSAGRDGIINAWQLNDVDVSTPDYSFPPMNPFSKNTINDKKRPFGYTTPKATIQIHTNWANDLVLANNYQSDLSVKLWNPRQNIQTQLGQHRDYVKCLASPSQSADWIASGGLDRRIISWDLAEGRGERFSIDVGDSDNNPKGSIYALAVNGGNDGTGTVIAGGGPESVVRLWDARTASPITQFIGHTDNIRSVLISKHGDWVLSASSDSSIKLWSVTAGRLLHTFDMHEDSLWCLYSTHPDLQTFYSADRSGMVVKSDLRGAADIEEDGIYTVVCNEHSGVSKIVAAGESIWTATQNSRIHRWRDFDTTPYALSGVPSKELPEEAAPDEDIPTNFLSITGEPLGGTSIKSVYENPVETLEGKTGLIKHRLLNDRRRVLTVDSAGEVKLWDLVQGIPLKSFGSRDIDDLADELTTRDAMAAWCQVTTRTGELYVTLDSASCFDAEVYVDEIIPSLNLSSSPRNPKPSEFRSDQRINLGKWVIRNLLSDLIEYEFAHDSKYRESIDFKPQDLIDADDSSNTASGASQGSDNGAKGDGIDCFPIDDGLTAESAAAGASTAGTNTPALSLAPSTVGDSGVNTPMSNGNGANGGGRLMGRLRSSFGKSKKDKDGKNGNGTNSYQASNKNTSTVQVPATIVEKPLPEDPQELTMAEVVTWSQQQYTKPASKNIKDQLITNGSIFNEIPTMEAPIIKMPSHIKIIISEQAADSGDTVDLYRGKVGSERADAEDIEAVAPEWIAKLILRNEIPFKETSKITFVVYKDENAKDGIPAMRNSNLRLTAYHMLRARKVLSYVTERLDGGEDIPEIKDAVPPEQWLELVCQHQTVDNNMTLATIRTRLWRSGGDVVVKYRRKIDQTI